VRCIYSQIYLVGVLDNVVIIFGRIKLCTGLTFGYLSLHRKKTISLKVKMATRKSRRRQGAIKIALSDIKSTSTCITLGLNVRALCCDNCVRQLEAGVGMSKKSSVPTKRFRDYEESGRRRCQQPWASKNSRSACHNATIRKFITIRKYLNIDTKVDIGGNDIDVELNDCYCYNKRVKTTTSLIYQVDNHEGDTQSNISNDGGTRDSASIGDGEPTDPPSDERLLTHPTLSPSPNNALVVTTALDPNPPSVSSPVADPSANFDTNHFELISKSALSRLRNEAKLGKKLRQKMQGRKYVGSPLGDRLIGIAMMHAPKLSLECAEKLIPLFLGAFLCDCGFEEEEMKNLGSVTPSANKIKAIMIEETVDTILTEKKEMTGRPVFLMCDKGDGDGKRGGASFVKLLARWSEEAKRVRVTSIGIEGAGNTTKSGADGIDHSLTLFDSPTNRFLLYGQGTDAGGGATRDDLKEKLHEKKRVYKMLDYIVSTCALHALNLTLSSPTILTMGEGG